MPTRPTRRPTYETVGETDGETDDDLVVGRPVIVTRAPLAMAFAAMAGFDDDLRFAHVLADSADDITMRRFRALDPAWSRRSRT